MKKYAKLVIIGGTLVVIGNLLYLPIAYSGSVEKLFDDCTKNMKLLDFVYGLGLTEHCSMIFHFEILSWMIASLGVLLVIWAAFIGYTKKKASSKSKIKKSTKLSTEN